MSPDHFSSLPFTTKAELLWKHGEFVRVQSKQELTVSLYKMPGFFVEVFYEQELNKIERIEVVEGASTNI